MEVAEQSCRALASLALHDDNKLRLGQAGTCEGLFVLSFVDYVSCRTVPPSHVTIAVAITTHIPIYKVNILYRIHIQLPPLPPAREALFVEVFLISVLSWCAAEVTTLLRVHGRTSIEVAHYASGAIWSMAVNADNNELLGLAGACEGTFSTQSARRRKFPLISPSSFFLSTFGY